MARIAYLIEVDPSELGLIGYLAGLLQGQGVTQAAILAEFVSRVQPVEVPDDFGLADDPETGDEPEEAEFEEITPATDPTAPENLGIDLGDRPPDRAGDFVPQSTAQDFGAGPPSGA